MFGRRIIINWRNRCCKLSGSAEHESGLHSLNYVTMNFSCCSFKYKEFRTRKRSEKTMEKTIYFSFCLRVLWVFGSGNHFPSDTLWPRLQSQPLHDDMCLRVILHFEDMRHPAHHQIEDNYVPFFPFILDDRRLITRNQEPFPPDLKRCL